MPTWTTKPLAPFGIEIEGLDLRGPLDDEALARLRGLVVDEGLVLLRDQRLSPLEHAGLGQRFGPIESLALAGEASGDGVLRVTNIAEDGGLLGDDDPGLAMLAINERWHTDSSFREVPASFSLFLAVVVPETGGETFFAHLGDAWDALDEARQQALLPLDGVHDYSSVGLPDRVHPLVRRHPESGRIGLYLSAHMRGVAGWPEAEGRALVAELLAHCTAEDRVYTHAWQAGDLLLWDNRTTLHRAAGFDERHPRLMHHVRIAGSEAVIPAEAGQG